MRLELALPRKAVVVALLLIALALAAVSMSLKLLQAQADSDSDILGSMVRLFDIDNEVSIATWFNAGLLLAAAGLLQLIACSLGEDRDRDRRFWRGLALIFAYLSMDEASNIHELITPFLQTFVDGSHWVSLAWTIPAVGLLLVFGVVFWPFWQRLPSPTRRLFAAAGILYVGGALVIDAVGTGLTTPGSVARLAVRTAEETAEMMGVILFIYTLLDFLAFRFPHAVSVSDDSRVTRGQVAGPRLSSGVIHGQRSEPVTSGRAAPPDTRSNRAPSETVRSAELVRETSPSS